MQAKDGPKITIAQSPFSPGDDPTADFVLQTSDNVRFWLCKAAVGRASIIFKDMFNIPHPPQDHSIARNSPNSEYADGKPIVRVTEDAAVVDVFMRCCYPVLRPALKATQLTTMLEVSDKYEAVAVRGYARQEVARYARQTEHCLRAYLIAYRYSMTEEMHTAARQALNLDKHNLLVPELPEHRAVPATALTQLQDYRTRCLGAISQRCTERGCVEHYKAGKPPMWEYCPNFDGVAKTGCACEVEEEPLIAETKIDDDHYVYYEPDGFHAVKVWFCRYLKSIRGAIQKDDTSIRRALFDPKAMSSAMRVVDKCTLCRQSVPGALLDLLRDIEGEIEGILSKIPFSEGAIAP